MEFITVQEAAKLLDVADVTVYTAIREGRLRSVIMLGKKALYRQDVLEYQQRTASVGKQGGRPRKQKQEGTSTNG